MKNWFLTGDFHGHYENLANRLAQITVENAAVIILGDAGFNFYLNKTDKRLKGKVDALGIDIYCVRGNHEQRPELVVGMSMAYDPEVENTVYYEPEFPHIKYFRDGAEYLINGKRALVLGGAYSVDKWYRLQKGWTWFVDEQLTQEEMDNISVEVDGNSYWYVFSHTCPLSWEPTDLFLRGLDQSTVDTSMEVWMERLKDTFDWNFWFFGHFHDDRWVRPDVQMYYQTIESLDEATQKWTDYIMNGIVRDDINRDPQVRW